MTPPPRTISAARLTRRPCGWRRVDSQVLTHRSMLAISSPIQICGSDGVRFSLVSLSRTISAARAKAPSKSGELRGACPSARSMFGQAVPVEGLSEVRVLPAVFAAKGLPVLSRSRDDQCPWGFQRLDEPAGVAGGYDDHAPGRIGARDDFAEFGGGECRSGRGSRSTRSVRGRSTHGTSSGGTGGPRGPSFSDDAAEHGFEIVSIGHGQFVDRVATVDQERRTSRRAELAAGTVARCASPRSRRRFARNTARTRRSMCPVTSGNDGSTASSASVTRRSCRTYVSSMFSRSGR